MHHYPHHIGDFNNATRHLTRVERSLYRDAIDLYYDTEQALIGDDFEYLAKRLLANSDEEKSALRGVLNEFFTLKDGAYHHSRCDAEIAKYRTSAESKSKAGKASAAKRKQKATHVEHVLNECATNQEPRTNNQEPRKEDENLLSGKPDESLTNGKKRLSESCLEVLSFLNEKTGRRYQPVKANINLIACRLREGATVDQCRQVIAKKCREWRDDPNQEIYLRPKTLFNATNFANYQGEVAE